jgi:hypothetical protein
MAASILGLNKGKKKNTELDLEYLGHTMQTAMHDQVARGANKHANQLMHPPRCHNIVPVFCASARAEDQFQLPAIPKLKLAREPKCALLYKPKYTGRSMLGTQNPLDMTWTLQVNLLQATYYHASLCAKLLL